MAATSHVETNYAGFWKRVVAYLIDYVITVFIAIIISFIAGFIIAVGAHSPYEAQKTAQSLSFVIGILVPAIYFISFHASASGATIGKKLIGIKVVRSNGQRLTIARSIGRYFASFLSSLLLCIGYIMAAFTERKQGLHDIICDTIVINR